MPEHTSIMRGGCSPVQRPGGAVRALTGSGLKDPNTAATLAARLHELPADLDAIERALGWA